MNEDRRRARNELATVFRLIRRERPDLARKLRRVLVGLSVQPILVITELPPTEVSTVH